MVVMIECLDVSASGEAREDVLNKASHGKSCCHSSGCESDSVTNHLSCDVVSGPSSGYASVGVVVESSALTLENHLFEV